jgi:adenylate cyclase
MLSIHVVNDRQDRQFEHARGPLELGRGPQQRVERIVVEDPFVSRDHLELEELSGDRLRIKNLSQKQPVVLPNGRRLDPGAGSELQLPVQLQIGNTGIAVAALPSEAFDEAQYQTLARPARQLGQSLAGLGDTPSAQTVANWLETIIALQRSPAGSREFYDQTARALVELVGLDLGMVLLREQETWQISGHYTASSTVSSRYSRTLLAHVLQEGRTFYQSLEDSKIQAESLQSLDAVVASPIFGLNDHIAGVLYGVRTWRGRGGIRPLEAQVVQLLAGALGANLVRTVATKTRTQFEQFFSPELTRELERDPNLLEGRNQEVTVMFSDLRGFTRLSERLGPEQTCRIVRDVMERLSDRIGYYGGAVVDYAGDGILAMWNAPVQQPDHVPRACRAALAMLAELPALNARWEAVCGVPLAIGIGLNSGPALVGNTGSSRRLKYGPFGLTVNLASRIQDATKRVGVPLLISGAVRDQLRSGFRTRSVGPVAIPGVSGEVELFELTGDQGTLTT